MRVIGGSKRGFKLIGPPEVQIEGLKPMPDNVRESLFNIIGAEIIGKKVLDLYAGTGAVGIEALSRGAKKVTFVELSKRIVEVIEKNLKKTGYEAHVIQRDALGFLESTKDKYDIIFITSPHEEINFKVLEKAGKSLKVNGFIVQESDKRTDIPEINGLEVFDQRKYGRLKLTFLRES